VTQLKLTGFYVGVDAAGGGLISDSGGRSRDGDPFGVPAEV